MKYKYKDIEENTKKYEYKDKDDIAGFTTWADKRKIDQLLQIDCNLYANLGTDSTRAEKDEVKRKSIEIYRTIKKINKELGDEFLLTMNLKQ